jgi:hypothetical protein
MILCKNPCLVGKQKFQVEGIEHSERVIQVKDIAIVDVSTPKQEPSFIVVGEAGDDLSLHAYHQWLKEQSRSRRTARLAMFRLFPSAETMPTLVIQGCYPDRMLFSGYDRNSGDGVATFTVLMKFDCSRLEWLTIEEVSAAFMGNQLASVQDELVASL